MTDLEREVAQLRRDLELLGACNDALRAELAAIRAGSIRGAAGLGGATAAEKRQRFVKWTTRRKS
jgi:hypothetical protein